MFLWLERRRAAAACARASCDLEKLTERPKACAISCMRITLHLVHPHDRARGGRERRERALHDRWFVRIAGCARVADSTSAATPSRPVPGDVRAAPAPRGSQVHEAARDGDLPQPSAKRGLVRGTVGETLEESSSSCPGNKSSDRCALSDHAADERKVGGRHGSIERLGARPRPPHRRAAQQLRATAIS